MHHIGIIGKYIILAMSSAKKHQDRSVLVLLTYRVLLHFTAINYGFQREKCQRRKADNIGRRLQKTACQTIKMTLRYVSSKSLDRIFSRWRQLTFCLPNAILPLPHLPTSSCVSRYIISDVNGPDTSSISPAYL